MVFIGCVDCNATWNFFKCSISLAANLSDIVLLLVCTHPSAYKNPNQYAFSSVSILLKNK